RMPLPGKHEVESVLKPFTNRRPFDILGNDPSFFGTVTQIMADPTIRTYNLRSLKYAASRISRMFDRIDFDIDPELVKRIVFGTIAFVFKKKKDDGIAWTDDARSPTELGTGRYPLHRFCYEYIRNYELDLEKLREANSVYLGNIRFRKENVGTETYLNTIYNCWENTVESIRDSLTNIRDDLRGGGDIPVADKVRLYRMLIELGSNTIEKDLTDECRTLIEEGLKGSDYDPELFVFSNTEFTKPGSEEEWTGFVTRFKEMSWSEYAMPSGFLYTPDTVRALEESFASDRFKDTGFAKMLDMDRFISMLKVCEPRQWNTVRSMFEGIYGEGADLKGFGCDLSALQILRERLHALEECDCSDRISYIHAKGLEKSLSQYIDKIGNGNTTSRDCPM
ncbi:MAG: hypothetical protein MJZ68_09940, partial [archaeon]|nr:hypothetical protein [archaeon]